MDDKPEQQASLADLLPLGLLECGICLSLVCQPVSISCGHTFCRTCLVKTLQRSAKRCPCCRAVCHARAEDQPQNVMIADIAKALFPELLERRMRETAAEKHKFELCLPAFFYHQPMFPGETLWLHFFEPRYKLMMKRIIDTSRRFAYVPNYTKNVAAKGDTALVAQVCDAEFLVDGRVMVKSKLVGRYHILDDFVEDGTQGLHYCQLEPYEDTVLGGGDSSELEELHAKARALCHGFLGPFKSQLVETHGDIPMGAVNLSMWMASFLPFYVAEKHALLQTACTRERLRACLRCVSSMEAVARGVIRQAEGSGAAEDPPQARAQAHAQAQAPPPPPPPPPPLPSAQPSGEAAGAQGVAAAAAAAATGAAASAGLGGSVGAAAAGSSADAGVPVSAWGDRP